MKVLRTTATFFPHVTGPAYQAFRISMGLEQRGHQSPIVTSDYTPADDQKGYPPEVESAGEIPFKVRRRKTALKFHQYRLPLTASLDYLSTDFDIVHCHGYHNAIKDLFYVLNSVKQKPFVVHGHGSFSKHKDPTIHESLHFKMYDKVWKRTVKNADAVLVSTEEEREDAIRFGIEKQKIHVVPVGKDPQTYTAVERNPPDDTFRLLFVGRLAPRRNIEMVLRALQKTKNEFAVSEDSIEVHIVGGEDALSEASGDSYLSELQSKCEKLGVNSQVTFCGPKYGDKLIEKYRSAHVFVNPTHFENFGQTSLEAAFAGLPLLTTDTGVGPELVRQSGGGFVVTDAVELAEKIVQLTSDREFCTELGNRIQRTALKDYTWDSIIDQYERIYKSLI